MSKTKPHINRFLGLFFLICFLVVTSGQASGAAAEVLKDRLSLDGKGYLRYSYDWVGSNGKNYNEFDIDRIYLGFTWSLSDAVKVRHLFEAGDLRENGTDQFETTTKQFYLEISDLLYRGSFLRFGLSDLPWTPMVDGLWGYRLQGPSFTDRSKFLTSTDLGLSLGGVIVEDYGSWQINLVNGEGWKKNETGKLKDVHARLTLQPIGENLFLTGGLTAGAYDGISAGNRADKRRYQFLVSYKDKGRFSLMGEWISAQDPRSKMSGTFSALTQKSSNELTEAKGFALYGTLNLGLFFGEECKKWEFISRYDNLDPDDTIADLKVTRLVAGVSYEYLKSFIALLNVESVNNRAGGPDERRIQFLTEVKF